MKFLLFFLTIFVFFNSCTSQKKEITDEELITLNNFKIDKQKINDSVIKINARKENYVFSGIQNKNGKEGWWKLYNDSDKKLIAEIQFLPDGKYDYPNQIIKYKNGKIDFSKSKFYKKTIKDNRIIYKVFYPSENNDQKQDLTFYYYINSKPKEYKKAEVTKEDNYYTFNVDCNEVKNLIGIFTINTDSKNYIMKEAKMKIDDTLNNACR